MGLLTEEDHKAVRSDMKRRYVFDEDILDMTYETWAKFNKFRKSGDFCDVEIECSDGVLFSHKCILSVASSFFMTLFTSPLASTVNHQKVNFKNYSVKTVDSVLEYIYNYPFFEIGDSTNVEELLELAEYTHLDSLVKELVESIRSTLDEGNCFEWCIVTKSCGVMKGFVIARSYILLNYEYLTEKHEELSSDIQNKVLSVNDPVFHKEIVLGVCSEISSSFLDGKDFCVINPSKKSVEDIREFYKRYLDLNCLQFFVYDLNLITVATSEQVGVDRYNDSYISQRWACLEENATFTLNKYDQLNCNFDEKDEVEIKLATLTSRGRESPYPFLRRYLASVYYDNDQSLYIVTCEWTSDNPTFRHKVFKIDLNSMMIFDNWITMEPKSKSLALVQSKTFGTILVDALNEVFLIGKFDFQTISKNSTHSPVSLNVSLEGCRRSKRRKLLPDDEGRRKSWSVLNYKDTVYWFGIFDGLQQVQVYLLDEKKICWIKLCTCDIPNLCEIDLTFQYEGKLFFSLIVSDSALSENARVELYQFDVEEKSATKTMDLPHSHSISVIPEYFFY